MSDKLEGIVLSKRKHTGGSLIVTVLSENGLVSFYFRGGEKKGQHLFPMACGTIIYKQNARSELHNMTSFDLEQHHRFIQDPRRVAISFFVAELLMKCTAEHNPDPHLYARCKALVHELDERAPKSLPLFILIELTHPLGIRIDLEADTKQRLVFDVQDGKIGHGIESELNPSGIAVQLIANYLNAEYSDLFERGVYRVAVAILLRYYAEHYPNVARMKSVEVLNETMA